MSTPKASQERQFADQQRYLETGTRDADRGARIIRRAVEIMKQGHLGWSWALKQAEKEVTQ